MLPPVINLVNYFLFATLVELRSLCIPGLSVRSWGRLSYSILLTRSFVTRAREGLRCWVCARRAVMVEIYKER